MLVAKYTVLSRNSQQKAKLFPNKSEQKKGELTVQLLRLDWNVAPPAFGARTFLSTHWWGQSPSENLVLLIPDGSCPPSLTSIYPLVSSSNQVYRYFQDMGALDFCLVVEIHNTEGNFVIEMGSFSMDISQLSDNHPIEATIPVFESGGVYLASATVRISLMYGPETPMASGSKPVMEALPPNAAAYFEHNENSPVNVFPGEGSLLRDVANKVAGIVTADGRDKLTVPQSPRKQLVFGVELQRKRQPVIDVDFNVNFPFSANLDLKPAFGAPITSTQEFPSVSPKRRQVFPRKAMKLRKQRQTKSPPGKTGPQSHSSPARIRSRSSKRREVDVKGGQKLKDSRQTLPGRLSGPDLPRVQKLTADSKLPSMSTDGKVHANSMVQSASSPGKSYKRKIQQKPLVPTATISKAYTPRSKTPPIPNAGAKGSMTTGETKTSSRLSSLSSREEDGTVSFVQCAIHPSAEEGRSTDGYISQQFDLSQHTNHLDFPDRHHLSGNLAILPDDMLEKYLEEISTGREKDESRYQESLQKLIQQIVTFRATLNRSSVAWANGCPPSEETQKLNTTKNTTLVQSFKQLDENIGSVNRLLTSLLTDSNNETPHYARVAQAEMLEDDPKDVAEVALVEELFFPMTHSEFRRPSTAKSESDGERKPLIDICEVRDAATQGKQALVEGLPLRYCEAKPAALKSESARPLPEALFRDPRKKNDNIPALNLCLTLKVGRLTLSESTLTETREYAVALSENHVGWRFKPDATVSSCHLTIYFPGLNQSRHVSTSAPAQSITISPTQLSGTEVYFENESQLHWNNVRMQSLESWKSERMTVRFSLSWDSGQTLICEGRVVLEEVFNCMPKVCQTKLDLFRVREDGALSRCDAANRSRAEPQTRRRMESCTGEAAASMTRTDSTPAAGLEITIDLLVQDSPGKAVMGNWLYVTVPGVTGSKLQPYDDEEKGHLLLVVKSDLQSSCQIPFYADWGASPGPGVKAWKPLKGSNPDGVLQGPKQTECPTLFIEVWRNWRGREPALAASSNNLIGLVKVPLKVTPNLTNENDEIFVVAEGDYYIWNPFKDVLCGTVETRIVMGSEDRMLKLLQQNRAARVIQSHAPSSRDASRAGKHNTSSVAEYNPFKTRNFGKDYRRKTVKHVIEVTVQNATDLPESATFAECEGTFIKYLFPCDEEAFYTQTMEWNKTIHFSASVHHGIILPSDMGLDNHLKSRKESVTNTGDLIFELWGCYASLSSEQIYPPNEQKLSDHGALSAWDMEKEPSCKHGGWNSGRQEILIGSSRLLEWSLLSLIASKAPSSSEVRKKFYLPIQLDPSLLEGAYVRAPSLAVVVTYFILNNQSRKNYVQGTIFSNVNLSEDSLFEGVVELDIIGATGLQEVEQIHGPHTAKFFTNGVNSYVRCSLFSSNQQLELKYPPCLTPVQTNSFDPHYKWTGRFKVVLDAPVLNELKTGHMSFEVWHHHLPGTRTNVEHLVPRKDSLSTDIWLGAAFIPTRRLLESRQGIEGWHDLLSNENEKVGAVNVQVYFKQWQVHPVGFTTTQPDIRRRQISRIIPRQQVEKNSWKC